MATNLKFLPISSASSILPSSGVRSSIHNKSSINTSSLSKNARHPLVSSIFKQDTAGKYSTPFRASYRNYSEEDDDDGEDCSFEAAAALFNRREYYRCHDVLESLWIKSEEPTRTLYHGILQCAVGFHHLFNQNHKGAMMELGEGLCKLRRMDFESGPFYQFEQEISAALDFIYHTQIELAACGDDLCVAMYQSERSYQLLGAYAAGQHLYRLQNNASDGTDIVFCPRSSYSGEPPKVKLPTLNAAEDHLMAYGFK
ncbi:hypothetical protein DKX38_008928 [Salix brachista]|uniref:DUF309 domain-containing protein n=1 Tax=Salix brachista TaxID=2182728 RepID=A0A5N5M9H6_9ROSI|nr:hypothetical protein DKX38_008928 [Salix brachista]